MHRSPHAAHAPSPPLRRSPGLGLVLALAFSCLLPTHASAIEIQADIQGFTDLEQGVIEAAIEWWEMSIGGTGVIQIDFRKVNLPRGVRGRTTNFMADGGGTPTSADIQIDTNGGGQGWFVDETPHDEEEFNPGPNGTFVAKSGSAAEDKADMLSTVKHEIAHALGFTRIFDNFGDNITDPGGGAPRTYTGDKCIWTLTPSNRGTHFCPEEHPGALIATGRGRGERRLQGKNELKILSDAFGYPVNYDVLVKPVDGLPTDLGQNAGQPTEYEAPPWHGTPEAAIEAELIFLQSGGDSAIDTDWTRIFAANGAVHWMRMVRPYGEQQIVESGSSTSALPRFWSLWTTFEDLDVWGMRDGEPNQFVEGAATFTYTFEEAGLTHSFSGLGIDLIEDPRYFQLYEEILAFYDGLQAGVAIGPASNPGDKPELLDLP